MTHLTRSYRLRVHARGTSTPGDGTVDFTLTDFLAVPSYGGQRVIPSEGRTATAPWAFRVQDAAGAVSSRLADATTGRAHLLGRIAEIQLQTDGGAWTTAAIGRLSRITQLPEIRAYEIEVSDERWLERRAEIFTAAETTQLYPPGIRGQWEADYGEPAPLGRLKVLETSGSHRRVELFSPLRVYQPALDWIRGDLRDDAQPSRADSDGNFEHLRLFTVSGATATEYPVVSFGDLESGFASDLEVVASSSARDPGWYLRFWIYAPSWSAGDGGFLAAPTAPPSDDLPLHIGVTPRSGSPDPTTWDSTNPWEIRKRIWDQLGVRYDATALQALIDSSWYPAFTPRITEPVRDVAAWAERAMDKPMMVLILIDSLGRLRPVPMRQPEDDPTSDAYVDVNTVFEFNGTNLREPPTWDHQEIINSLTMRYRLAQAQSGPFRNAHFWDGSPLPADGRILAERSLTKEHDNVADVGTKGEEFDLTALITKPLLPSGIEFFNRPFTFAVTRQAALLAREYFQVYGDGAQRGTLRSLRAVQDGSGRTPEDVEPGDVVRLNVETLPNAAINDLGGQRLVRILSRRPTADGVEFDFLDVGPAVQPWQSTTTTVTGTGKHSVSVSLSTLPSGAAAELQIAVTETSVGSEPGQSSRLWGPAPVDPMTTTGPVTISGLPSGKRIWVRAVVTGRGITKGVGAADYGDTTALAAPTGLSATVDGTSVVLSFTPAEAGYPIVPVIRPGGGGTWTEAVRTPLPAGSTRYVFHTEAASTSWDVGVKHVDDFGGESAVAFVNTSTGSTPRTLTAPEDPQVLQGYVSGPRDLPPEEQIIGYGLQVRARITEPAARLVAQVSTDAGFSSIDDEFEAEAGRRDLFVFTGGLDDVTRYVRFLHRREGFTDSAVTAVVSAKPTALLPERDISDSFAGGTGDLEVLANGKIRFEVSAGGDQDTDRAYYEYAKNPAGDTFPDVDETDRYIDAANFPYADVLTTTGGADETVVVGDLILMRVRFWNATQGFGQELLIRLPVLALPSGTDTVLPTVQEQIRQSGGTGYLDLVINDPDGLVTATSFLTQSGAGDFDASTDPETWPGYDATAPFDLSESVALSAKHNSYIAWAVRYDPGTGDEWIQGAITYDADLIPEVTSLALGFDDQGYATAKAVGDNDAVGIGIAAGINSDPVVPGQAFATSGGTSSGSTLRVNTTIYADVGDWLVVNPGGSPHDIVRITAVGAGQYSVTPNLSTSWGIGVTIRKLGEGFVSARSGSVRLNGFDSDAIQATTTGDELRVRAAAVASDGTVGPATQTVREIYTAPGDETIAPSGRVQAVRSGNQVTVTVEVDDPDLVVTAIEFKVREGAGSLSGSWLSTWDTATGTVGASTALTRSETVTSPDGLDSEFLWRVTWSHPTEGTQTKGGTINLATLRELSKDLVVHAAEAIPSTDATRWSVSGRVSIAPGAIAVGQQRYQIPLVLPIGVEITQFRCRLYRETVNETAEVSLYRYPDETSAPSTLGTATGLGSGVWVWRTALVSETVTSTYAYVLEIRLNANSQGAGFGAQCGRIEVSYNAPDYSKTI